MSNAQTPTESEIQGFLGGLQQYRSTLSETNQRLLDAMVAAATGKPAQEAEEEEVHPFWVAYHNPVGPAGGVGYGTTVATPYGAAGFTATPWGTAYGAVRY